MRVTAHKSRQQRTWVSAKIKTFDGELNYEDIKIEYSDNDAEDIFNRLLGYVGRFCNGG